MGSDSSWQQQTWGPGDVRERQQEDEDFRELGQTDELNIRAASAPESPPLLFPKNRTVHQTQGDRTQQAVCAEDWHRFRRKEAADADDIGSL